MPVSLLGAPIFLYNQTSQTLAAATSAVLGPVSPSPGGGYAPCNQVGYEISISNLAAASNPTVPFVEVLVQFFDDDVAQALPVGTPLVYYVPVGYGSGSSPCVISGSGPLRGQFMSVTLTNLDPAIGVGFTLLLRGTTRSYPRDDWRWPGGSQVPGYTAPVVGAGLGSLVLAAINHSLPQGTPAAPRLLPLFAGKVRLRVNCTGLTGADAATLTIATINAEGGKTLYMSPNMGDTVTELSPQPEISLPRDCCLMTLTNNAAPGGGTAAFQVMLMAEEY